MIFFPSYLSKSSITTKSFFNIIPALNLDTLFHIHPPTAPYLKNSAKSYPPSSSFLFVSFSIKAMFKVALL